MSLFAFGAGTWSLKGLKISRDRQQQLVLMPLSFSQNLGEQEVCLPYLPRFVSWKQRLPLSGMGAFHNYLEARPQTEQVTAESEQLLALLLNLALGSSVGLKGGELGRIAWFCEERERNAWDRAFALTEWQRYPSWGLSRELATLYYVYQQLGEQVLKRPLLLVDFGWQETRLAAFLLRPGKSVRWPVQEELLSPVSIPLGVQHLLGSMPWLLWQQLQGWQEGELSPREEGQLLAQLGAALHSLARTVLRYRQQESLICLLGGAARWPGWQRVFTALGVEEKHIWISTLPGLETVAGTGIIQFYTLEGEQK